MAGLKKGMARSPSAPASPDNEEEPAEEPPERIGEEPDPTPMGTKSPAMNPRTPAPGTKFR